LDFCWNKFFFLSLKKGLNTWHRNQSSIGR